MAAGLWNGTIFIYNINTRNLIASLLGHTSCVEDLVLMGNDGNTLASSSYDGTVRIWNLTTYTNIFNLTGHNRDRQSF